MKTSLIACVAAASLTFAAAGTQAAPFLYVTPSSNAVFGQAEGYVGANLYAIGNLRADVWYLGSNVSWEWVKNTFTFIDMNNNPYDHTVDISDNNEGPKLIAKNKPIASGLVNFSFTLWEGDYGVSVNNGSNQNDPLNFFLSFTCSFDSNDVPVPGSCGDRDIDGSSPGAGKIVMIAFNDGTDPNYLPGTGQAVGWNYDDLVIVMRVTPDPVTTHEAPEPASLGLFGLGLTALGLSRRRRRAR